MFSSLSRRSERTRVGDKSPFSSPHSNIQASPIAARRSSLEERRRPAARFDNVLSPEPAERIPEEDEEDEELGDEEDEEDNQEDEDPNEDEAGELSPLLPIFSAAHLGTGCLDV